MLPKFALEKNVEKLKNLTNYFEDKISEKNITMSIYFGVKNGKIMKKPLQILWLF
jgi:hypothetical protein